MYILYILLNLIIIAIKKKNYPTHGFNLTQLNPYGLGWIFFNPLWWLGWKNHPT